MKKEYQMKKEYILPVNRRIIAMKHIIAHYPVIICRDIQSFWPGSPSLRHIKDQFQIGYLPTLSYISFNRGECLPFTEWVEGFIEAASRREKYYKNYPFHE